MHNGLRWLNQDDAIHYAVDHNGRFCIDKFTGGFYFHDLSTEFRIADKGQPGGRNPFITHLQALFCRAVDLGIDATVQCNTVQHLGPHEENQRGDGSHG